MLSKDDVDKMVREAESHADEDKQRREEVELRNQAEQLTYQAERTLKDLGDKVSGEDRATVETQVSALREALKGSDVALIQAGMNDGHGDALPRVDGRVPGVRGGRRTGRRRGRPTARRTGPATAPRRAPATRRSRASSRRSEVAGAGQPGTSNVPAVEELDLRKGPDAARDAVARRLERHDRRARPAGVRLGGGEGDEPGGRLEISDR